MKKSRYELGYMRGGKLYRLASDDGDMRSLFMEVPEDATVCYWINRGNQND